MRYELSEIIRYSQTDEQLRLTVSSLIDLFQDAATLQAEEAGVGVNILNEQRLGWFLVSWNVEILRMPKHAEQVIAGTFPYRFHGRFGNRNCYLRTPEGEYLAKADSIWAMMDKERGQLVPIPDWVSGKYEIGEPLSMDYQGRRIHLPPDLSPSAPIPVLPEHIDYHGHVNNSQYLRMIQHLLPKGELTGFRVEYKGQTRAGETLTPYVSDEPGRMVISLRAGGEERTNLEFRY